MTGIDPDEPARRLRWAAEQLGLSPHASADEVRAAWLRRLPADDFVPSSESRWALEALLRRQTEGGWEARADEAASRWEGEQLRGEVEAFAIGFWELPADERRRRWQMLADRCAFAPALRVRLLRLEAGLDIDLREPADKAKVSELAGHVRELFVLRPGPRARARRALLHRMRDNWNEWRIASQRLRHGYPALAALGNDLLDKQRSAKPTPQHPRVKPLPQVAEANNKQLTPLMWIWIILIVGLFFFRILNGVQKLSMPPPSSSQFPSKPFEPYGDKKIPPTDWDRVLDKKNIRDKKLREEVKKILTEQDRKKRSGKSDKTDIKNP